MERTCMSCKWDKKGMICLQGHVRRIKYENLVSVGHIDLENCHAWKEKKICWCGYSNRERNNWNVSVKDREGLPNLVWNIAYCPVCGRPMKED